MASSRASKRKFKKFFWNAKKAMYSSIRIIDVSRDLPKKELIRLKASDDVQRHVSSMGDACYFDYLEPSAGGRSRKAKQKRLNFYEERLKEWDREQCNREQKYESVADISHVHFMELISLYHKEGGMKEATLRKRTEAMLAKAKCECWEYEYDRLVFLFHRLYMETERGGLNLSDSLKNAIRRFYNYRLYDSTTQEKRIQTLKKNKTIAKDSPRKRIMGLVIDELLMDTVKQGKSKTPNSQPGEGSPEVRLKRAITHAMQRWEKYPPNHQKKLKGNTRQVRLQNMRRRYFPEGISEEPIIKHVVQKIKQGEEAALALKKYKSSLGKRNFQNCAVTVAKAELLYEKIEKDYHLSRPKRDSCELGKVEVKKQSSADSISSDLAPDNDTQQDGSPV